MFCSQLSVLNNITDGQTIEKFQRYLTDLSDNAAQNITVSSVSRNICVNKELAKKMLRVCLEEGILNLEYGIRCPECGQMIKRSRDPLRDIEVINSCYRCAEEIHLTQTDIVAVFVFKGFKLPFVKGQQRRPNRENDGISVAHEDTFLEVFSDIFNKVKEDNPDKSSVECIRKMICDIIPFKEKDSIMNMSNDEKRKMMRCIHMEQFVLGLLFILVLALSLFGLLKFVIIIYNASDKIENIKMILGLLEVTVIGGTIVVLKNIYSNLSTNKRIEKYLLKQKLKRN